MQISLWSIFNSTRYLLSQEKWIFQHCVRWRHRNTKRFSLPRLCNGNKVRAPAQSASYAASNCDIASWDIDIDIDGTLLQVSRCSRTRTSRVRSVMAAPTRPRSTSTAASRARGEAACGNLTTPSGTATTSNIELYHSSLNALYSIHKVSWPLVPCALCKLEFQMRVREVGIHEVLLMDGT